MKQKTFRIPRNKKVTVDDLFAQADVNNILKDLNAEKQDIKSLVIIQQNKEGLIAWRNSKMSLTHLTGLLEQVKVWTLTEDYDDDD